jgi:hypothetical protein
MGTPQYLIATLLGRTVTRLKLYAQSPPVNKGVRRPHFVEPCTPFWARDIAKRVQLSGFHREAHGETSELIK